MWTFCVEAFCGYIWKYSVSLLFSLLLYYIQSFLLKLKQYLLFSLCFSLSKQSWSNINTDITLNVAFSRFRVCLFTKTRPDAETQTISAIPLSCHSTVHVRYSLGLCLRVIVKENPQNLEKTTYNVLSVILLIYGFNNMLTPISI